MACRRGETSAGPSSPLSDCIFSRWKEDLPPLPDLTFIRWKIPQVSVHACLDLVIHTGHDELIQDCSVKATSDVGVMVDEAELPLSSSEPLPNALSLVRQIDTPPAQLSPLLSSPRTFDRGSRLAGRATSFARRAERTDPAQSLHSNQHKSDSESPFPAASAEGSLATLTSVRNSLDAHSSAHARSMPSVVEKLSDIVMSKSAAMDAESDITSFTPSTTNSSSVSRRFESERPSLRQPDDLLLAGETDKKTRESASKPKRRSRVSIMRRFF